MAKHVCACSPASTGAFVLPQCAWDERALLLTGAFSSLVLQPSERLFLRKLSRWMYLARISALEVPPRCAQVLTGMFSPTSGRIDDRWAAFMRFQIGRARQCFADAEAGVDHLDADARWPVWSALILYRWVRAADADGALHALLPHHPNAAPVIAIGLHARS